MKYRRVMLIASLAADTRAALATVRRAAPHAQRLAVVAWLPARTASWLSPEAPPELDRAANAALDELRTAAAGVADDVAIDFVDDLDIEALDTIARAAQAELLVAAALPFGGLSILAELRKRRSTAVLWLPENPPPDASAPMRNLACVAIGRRASAAVSRFLRERCEPDEHATVLLLGTPAPHDPAAAIAVDGIAAKVDFAVTGGESPWKWIETRMKAEPIDLLVFARFPAVLLLGTGWPVPTLLLPLPARSAAPALQGRIDAADLVDDGASMRTRLEYAVGLGRRTPIADQRIAFVSGARIVAEVDTRDGEVELPSGLAAEAYGIARTTGAPEHPVIEQQVVVLRPGDRPLLLFDADLADEALEGVAAYARHSRLEGLAVRVRPMRGFDSIRERLAAAGLQPRAIDGRAVLDEGPALDVPDAVDAVRLARVAARMRAVGFPVAAIVYRGAEPPAAIGFEALRADELATRPAVPAIAGPLPVSLAARLEATTGAALLTDNRIEVELDNVTARRWLLEAIAGSRQRIHLQVYMAADDDVGRAVEKALIEAAQRGVEVRMLVDSLHGLHGSLGARNPLLERLDACPGIALRVYRPIALLPSLQDLKQRDHRKLVVVDNRLALLGGRNLSHEYYTGFDEVALTPQSLWREVPWLDAGARVAGPAVAALERSFLQAWVDAGGTGYPVAESPPAGPSSARVVVHRGLRDAYTLEAYLAIIDAARSHLHVVNGFPLVLEIQHALLRALRRGVRVRTLFGHLTPTHADEPFAGSWASARSAATALVHSRIDALIEAGADGYQFAVPQRPGWSPGLGEIRSHVHAKLMCADGRVCAVGSANMDITGGYWETELLLVVEDAALAAAVEARVDELMAASARVDRNDPQWQQLASWRQWLRYWPGVLTA